jgi:hypothetical protein
MIDQDLSSEFPEFNRKKKEQNTIIFTSEFDTNKKNIVIFDFSTILKGEWNRPKNNFPGYKIKCFVQELHANKDTICPGSYEIVCNLSFMQCLKDSGLAIKTKKKLSFIKKTQKIFEIKEMK